MACLLSFCWGNTWLSIFRVYAQTTAPGYGHGKGELHYITPVISQMQQILFFFSITYAFLLHEGICLVLFVFNPTLKYSSPAFHLLQNSNMPKDLDSASMMCCSILSNPNTKPLIIFIDALNQVSPLFFKELFRL